MRRVYALIIGAVLLSGAGLGLHTGVSDAGHPATHEVLGIIWGDAK